MKDLKGLLPAETLGRAAECLRAVAHPVRLRMVEILMRGEFAVHEIASMCGVPAAQACEHLRMLKAHGLLGSVRKGHVVYYQVASPQLPNLLACIRRSCNL